jgi:hypothetical protein
VVFEFGGVWQEQFSVFSFQFSVTYLACAI